jgi:hypothetical protein
MRLSVCQVGVTKGGTGVFGITGTNEINGRSGVLRISAPGMKRRICGVFETTVVDGREF